MSRRKKYFPNKIRSIQLAPDKYFQPVDAEELFEWRVYEWTLPDTIAAVIRCENSKTGKITEHIYQQCKSAKNKIDKLISDPNNLLTIVTQDSFFQAAHELHSLFED